jgi:hypothetical protein
MREVDTGVDDGHGHGRAARRDRPRLLRVDVGIGGAGDPVHRLAEVIEPPELVHRGVVRAPAVVVGVENEVRLRVGHPSVALEFPDGLPGFRRVDRDERPAQPVEAPPALGPRAREDLRLAGGRNARPEAHDHLAGDSSTERLAPGRIDGAPACRARERSGYREGARREQDEKEVAAAVAHADRASDRPAARRKRLRSSA